MRCLSVPDEHLEQLGATPRRDAQPRTSRTAGSRGHPQDLEQVPQLAAGHRLPLLPDLGGDTRQMGPVPERQLQHQPDRLGLHRRRDQADEYGGEEPSGHRRAAGRLPDAQHPRRPSRLRCCKPLAVQGRPGTSGGPDDPYCGRYGGWTAPQAARAASAGRPACTPTDARSPTPAPSSAARTARAPAVLLSPAAAADMRNQGLDPTTRATPRRTPRGNWRRRRTAWPATRTSPKWVPDGTPRTRRTRASTGARPSASPASSWTAAPRPASRAPCRPRSEAKPYSVSFKIIYIWRCAGQPPSPVYIVTGGSASNQ